MPAASFPSGRGLTRRGRCYRRNKAAPASIALVFTTFSVMAAPATFAFTSISNVSRRWSRLAASNGLRWHKNGLKCLHSQNKAKPTTVLPAKSTSAEPTDAIAKFSNRFLDEVEFTISDVLSSKEATNYESNILSLPETEREAVGVAINMQTRLNAMARNGDCRRCWLQRKHCICDRCPPLEGTRTSAGKGRALRKVHRLFLLTHHKEIGLVVDTAKLLLASFPQTARLVVSGVSREHQQSMGELIDAMDMAEDDSMSRDRRRKRKCLVLFPSEDARTFDEIERELLAESGYGDLSQDDGWDVIVIDGTWAQARKIYNRYIPPHDEGGPFRVKLSDEAVQILNGDSNRMLEVGQKMPGHQLRRHPIKWREVSTLEATRLLLRDMMGARAQVGNEAATKEKDSGISGLVPWDTLAGYQMIANKAARHQLGPPRV